jgi:hypothetical protein
MGQSNMAAGATIGSNHNSRSADGELVAGRGFWPGLCVSLKHNSKFASFTLLSKGDFPAELNIPIPFSLIINEVRKDQLTVMPGYWLMYNMYALARNAWKYVDRDHRIEKIQEIEYDFLAPDSINEILHSLKLFKRFTGIAWFKKFQPETIPAETEALKKGEALLETKDPQLAELEIVASGFENTSRKVQLVKVPECYELFKRLVFYHAGNQLSSFVKAKKIKSLEEFLEILPARLVATEWTNLGGQMMPAAELNNLVKQIRTGKIKTWPEVHGFYKMQSTAYPLQKLVHALAAVQQLHAYNWKKQGSMAFKEILLCSLSMKEWMTERIFKSREKDYKNPFRQMVYESPEEMNKVTGALEDNNFINQEKLNLETYRKTVKSLIRQFGL